MITVVRLGTLDQSICDCGRQLGSSGQRGSSAADVARDSLGFELPPMTDGLFIYPFATIAEKRRAEDSIDDEQGCSVAVFLLLLSLVLTKHS